MAHADPLSSILSAFQRDHVLPDVLPETFNASVLFSIVYPNGAEVLLGNELTVDDTQDEPEIRFAAMNMPWEQVEIDEEPGSGEVAYTLAMVDPDAPSRAEPLYKSFRHWVITGLKSPPLSTNAAAELNALKTKPSTTPYRPPGPPPKSGLHRYVFLLFQEPASGTPFVVPQGEPEYGAALEERRSWDPIAFGERYGLKLVGANHFLVRAATE
ncbi:Phosphatidylethanolamine-binding F40A3.3 [Grifola frondosa]|uniref:Phosphatidylethanolamine-binding F40A3.3 n=1 Tax=Grifola frondosa TaxID=5627 RepID=A0A1C7MNI1_GRIFR|nr:Phosphatidylethanolamine-binding F40A3.3 [Grifola frondosa]